MTSTIKKHPDQRQDGISVIVPPSIKDFLAGTAGGFFGKLLDYPLDTVKVLLQTSSSSSSTAGSTATVQYRSAWHCFRHTCETNGFMSLYKGISAPLVGSMAENAILFWMYGHCKRFVMTVSSMASGGTEPIWAARFEQEIDGDDFDDHGHNMSLLQLSFAGAAAGCGAATILTPVELIKCRMQVQNNIIAATASGDAVAAASGHEGFVRYKGPLDVFLRTIREEGIFRGLYRGHTSTLLREIPGNFVWYGVYESVCRFHLNPPNGIHTKSDLPITVHMIGGAAAGVGYWTAFYPADTVKSMQQTRPDLKTKGFVDVFRTVFNESGVAGLYRGWAITAIRAAPSHAAIFAIYEQTIQWLN
jgi:hypothetical protein